MAVVVVVVEGVVASSVVDVAVATHLVEDTVEVTEATVAEVSHRIRM